MNRFVAFLQTGLMVLASVTLGSGPSAMAETLVDPPQTGLTRIVFYRNPLAGIGVQPAITLNGQPIGASPLSGGYFYVDRTPGAYEIVLSKYLGSPKTSLTLEEGGTAYVKISLKFIPFLGSYLSPEVVDSATGAREIQGLTRSGGPPQ